MELAPKLIRKGKRTIARQIKVFYVYNAVETCVRNFLRGSPSGDILLSSGRGRGEKKGSTEASKVWPRKFAKARYQTTFVPAHTASNFILERWILLRSKVVSKVREYCGRGGFLINPRFSAIFLVRTPGSTRLENSNFGWRRLRGYCHSRREAIPRRRALAFLAIRNKCPAACSLRPASVINNKIRPEAELYCPAFCSHRAACALETFFITLILSRRVPINSRHTGFILQEASRA